MAVAENTSNNFVYISPSRRRTMGIVLLVIAFGIWILFSRGMDTSLVTTFVMMPGGSAVEAADWVFHSARMMNILAGVSAALGAYQLVRGFGKYTNLILGLVAGFFIFSFLAWAAADKSLNMAGLLRSMLVKSIPLTLGAMSGILCERSGIVNIAIEGMMLTGAFVGAFVGSLTNQYIGLFGAILAGGFLALILAWLSIRYKVDQIISGTVINIFATGLTSFLSAKFLQKYQAWNSPDMFRTYSIPFLSDIPMIGPIFFDHNMFVYATYILLILLTVGLFYTRWGLRLRSVGEHPKAADTLGIPVNRTRYISTVLGGMMAGFAGAYFTLGSVGRFDEVMTGGRGFIALAAMIFGNWHPVGSFGASLLFGFADSLASKLAILGVRIPSELLLMAPYIATMIVLAGVIGSGHAPAAEGKPYEKE